MNVEVENDYKLEIKKGRLMDQESLKLPHDIHELQMRLTWQEWFYIYSLEIVLGLFLLSVVCYLIFKLFFYLKRRAVKKVFQSTLLNAMESAESFLERVCRLGMNQISEDSLALLSRDLKIVLSRELGESLVSKSFHEISALHATRRCRVEAQTLIEALEGIENNIYSSLKTFGEPAQLENFLKVLRSVRTIMQSYRLELAGESSNAV